MTAKELFRLVDAASRGDVDAVRKVREWASAHPEEARFEARRNFRLQKFLPAMEEARGEVEELF